MEEQNGYFTNNADQGEDEFNRNIEEWDELDLLDEIDFLEFQKDLYAMALKPFMVSADEQADDECDIANSDVLV